MMTDQFYGVTVLENRYMTELVQAKTHKKKRINKKWLKRYGYNKVPRKDSILFRDENGNVNLIIHPKYAARLREDLMLRKQERN